MDYVDTAESVCPNVSATIDENGYLLLHRNNTWKKQICPYHKKFGFFDKPCGDWCPKFSDVYTVCSDVDEGDEDFSELESQSKTLCLEICNSIYMLDCFTDRRCDCAARKGIVKDE
jgi:hypothetical protein